MGLSTWQLAEISLTTSYPWFPLVFALRGVGLGCLIQPLTVSALSKVSRSQYTQASSLNTVIRFTFTSLGVAVLATFAQSQTTTHITTLIQQARPVSRAAVALIEKQGLDLGVQDAFWLSLVALAVALIAACFIRVPKPVPQAEGKIASAEQTIQPVS